MLQMPGEEGQLSAAGIYLVWDPMHQRAHGLVRQVLTGSSTGDRSGRTNADPHHSKALLCTSESGKRI